MITEQEFDDNITPIELLGSVLLFLLVFGMSATVNVDNLGQQLKNKKAILTGVFLQFILLPFLGFLTVKLLQLDKVMGITLLVVTSSPGGSYSNWWCSMFNADLALSVTMTTVSTFLSLVALPINLLIYTKNCYDADVVKNLDWTALFTALVTIIAAVGGGIYCSARIQGDWFRVFANKLGNVAGISLVVFSFAMTSSDEEADLIGRPAIFYIGVAAPCLMGLLVSNIVTSYLDLKTAERMTVSVECCYQNVGIATSVALTMFEGDDLALALGVPLYYGIVEAVVLAVYCIGAWKAGWSKAPSDEPFWEAVSNSYELSDRASYMQLS